MGIAAEFPVEGRFIKNFALKRALMRAMKLFRGAPEANIAAHHAGTLTFYQVIHMQFEATKAGAVCGL